MFPDLYDSTLIYIDTHIDHLNDLKASVRGYSSFTASSLRHQEGPKLAKHTTSLSRDELVFRRDRSVMEVCGSSNVSLREFGCEQSLLSRPDGSASFVQGNDTYEACFPAVRQSGAGVRLLLAYSTAYNQSKLAVLKSCR